MVYSYWILTTLSLLPLLNFPTAVPIQLDCHECTTFFRSCNTTGGLGNITYRRLIDVDTPCKFSKMSIAIQLYIKLEIQLKAVEIFDTCYMISLSILGDLDDEGNLNISTDKFSPGPHNLTLMAFDHFGNTTSSNTTFISPGVYVDLIKHLNSSIISYRHGNIVYQMF